ncbi:MULTISPECIES: hypothetical protein [unclassified Sphingomonas]|uniref:hypothetical protein n=1 Tax=unclassified Sphingomonas TaxID=196159 RepID=UPI00226AEBF8|nr:MULTISPECIES: hypothetical protein [unclassified Sphingomonas]
MIVLQERLWLEPGGKLLLPLGSLFMYGQMMAEAIVRTEKRGRPRTDATSIHLTLPPPDLKALDAWIAADGSELSRPEAVRRVLRQALPQNDDQP